MNGLDQLSGSFGSLEGVGIRLRFKGGMRQLGGCAGAMISILACFLTQSVHRPRAAASPARLQRASRPPGLRRSQLHPPVDLSAGQRRSAPAARHLAHSKSGLTVLHLRPKLFFVIRRAVQGHQIESTGQVWMENRRGRRGGGPSFILPGLDPLELSVSLPGGRRGIRRLDRPPASEVKA